MTVHLQLCIGVLLVGNKIARVAIGWDNPVSAPVSTISHHCVLLLLLRLHGRESVI
jgi:hypothetical protein